MKFVPLTQTLPQQYNPSMDNIYRATNSSPRHLSVGAVVFNDRNQVLANHYSKFGHLENIYTLMSQTHTPDTTLEQTLKVGLLKEFNIETDLSNIQYLGSRQYSDKWFEESPTVVEKTVLYFRVDVGNVDLAIPDGFRVDECVEVEYVDINELIALMEAQYERCGVGHLDESWVLRGLLSIKSKN